VYKKIVMVMAGGPRYDYEEEEGCSHVEGNRNGSSHVVLRVHAVGSCRSDERAVRRCKSGMRHRCAVLR
jgi:threonine dehydrogenase-like Zn-dependent dehydrogenase